MKIHLVVTVVTLFVTVVFARSHRWTTGFVRSRHLLDGERERRVHWKRITALETAVEFPTTDSTEFNRTLENDEDNVVVGTQQSLGLVLRQVTDGHHFIQLIYDSSLELRDCEYIQDRNTVRKFLNKFRNDFDCAMSSNNFSCEESSGRNETFKILRERRASQLPTDILVLTDYRRLRKDCRDLHRKIRKLIRGRKTEKDHSYLDRIKRELFLYPGTNWCGSGNSARKFNELGYNAAADRCCRDHDHCPYTIEAFTKKFNFFNYRFHTVSHCECDERFRACLKLASTGAANMVGKLFFNVVQTKCFIFKPIKTCVKRSWWGKCMRQDKIKTAHLRDALIY